MAQDKPFPENDPRVKKVFDETLRPKTPETGHWVEVEEEPGGPALLVWVWYDNLKGQTDDTP